MSWPRPDGRSATCEPLIRTCPQATRSGQDRGMYGPETRRNLWPRWIDHENRNRARSHRRRPEDIAILVAGGAGRHSVYLPGWGARSVTRKVLG